MKWLPPVQYSAHDHCSVRHKKSVFFLRSVSVADVWSLFPDYWYPLPARYQLSTHTPPCAFRISSNPPIRDSVPSPQVIGL